jgi:hypothetical protein
MTQPIRILAFWGASDFEEFFQAAFCNRPEYQVEIVSGDRSRKKSPHVAVLKRLISLRQRVAAGEFDLILSGNIWNTPWPRHKGIWTKIAQAGRFYTYKRRMLDTHWAPWIARAGGRRLPLAVLDLRDSPFVLPWDWPLLQACSLYFKRELFFMPERSLLPLRLSHGDKRVTPMIEKLRPLTYGVRPSHLERPNRPMAERDIDIFMSGGSNPIRAALKERLKKLSGRYRVQITEGFLPDQEYDEMLQRARLVVCTESYGCETWRQYEVAAAGAVPLLNWPYTQNYRPFEPDRHAVYFSLIGDHFERQIDYALGRPEMLQEISTATREFVRRNKDRRTIADYIVAMTLEKK